MENWPFHLNEPESFALFRKHIGNQFCRTDFPMIRKKCNKIVFLGNWPEEVDPATQPTNHSPYFHMHEPYMERGVKAYGHMVVDFLNSQQTEK